MNDECDFCGAPTDAKDGFCPTCREESRANLARALQQEKDLNRREG